MLKETKKVKIKKSEKKIKVVEELPKLQDKNYWLERKKEDTKFDWGEEKQSSDQTWIDGYVNSGDHPHRDILIEVLRSIPMWGSILEVGCNAGANLKNIDEKILGKELYGIDINQDAVEELKKNVPNAKWGVFNVEEGLPWSDEAFDVVLTDAVLMYVGPDKIEQVIKELVRLSKKAVVLVEWYDKSKLGVEKYHHWARNYPQLLKEAGVKKVKEIKLNEELWPSENWSKVGRIFIAHLQ